MSVVVHAPSDRGVCLGAPPARGRKRDGRRGAVLLATILGSSLAFIDGTVVNVALPVLQRDLRATSAGAQWVIEAYTLVLAALMLVGGSLGDRFGRRLVFAIGVAVFTLASVLCGLTPNVATLIAGRLVQGVGGVLLIPGSLALISANFEPNERGKAIGTWSAFTGIAAAIGPILGGWLVDHASWRYVFFINLPIALAVLTIASRVPESREHQFDGPMDWIGAAFETVGLGGLTVALIESATAGWRDAPVLAALGAGIVGSLAFIAVELHSKAPMMPPALFRSRTFSGVNLLTLAFYAALGAAFYFIPFDLIQVQRYSATAAGAALLPLILINFALSRWSGGLVDRFGARPPLVIGPTIAAVGFLLFALPGVGGSYWLTYFPAAIVLGVGLAITVAPLTTTVMSAVPAEHAGLASGINNAVARIAGLIAIAAFGLVIQTAFDRALVRHAADARLPPQAVRTLAEQRTKLAAIDVPRSLDASTRAAMRTAVDRAFVDGFRAVMLGAALLSLLGALLSFTVIARAQPTGASAVSGRRFPSGLGMRTW